MSAAFYWFVTRVVQFIILPLYARVEVRGVEKVPLKGPLIVASNHLNDADPGILSSRIPRRLVFMAKVELFHIPVIKWILRGYGAFPVRRGEADLSSLRRSSQTLKEGLALVLFPEGTRAGARATLGEAWPGAGLLALRQRVPVLPVAITGSQHMAMPWMFVRVCRRYRVTLTIGEPFFLPPVERVNADAARQATDVIMRKIAALLPEEYRGYYGDEAARVPAAQEEPPRGSPGAKKGTPGRVGG
jgi:1-acyl-sn-glycerol-3-phosphate acyltransferase